MKLRHVYPAWTILAVLLLLITGCAAPAADQNQPEAQVEASATAVTPASDAVGPALEESPVPSEVVPQTGGAEMAEEVQADFQCSAPAEITPPMTEGPYYKTGAPERTSLIEPGVPGEKLVLSGYVLDENCQPIPGALVDFWQADGEGRYDNSGYVLRGLQYTAEDGSYRLETVLPGEYPGRTPHIHVKVQAPGGPVTTTQVYFPGEQANQSDRIFDERLLVSILDGQEGMNAAFNFILPVHQ